MFFLEKERCCLVSFCQNRRKLLSRCLWRKKKKRRKKKIHSVIFFIFPFSFTLHRSDKCWAIKVHLLSLYEVLHNVSCARTQILLSASIVLYMLSLVLYFSLVCIKIHKVIPLQVSFVMWISILPVIMQQ